MSAAVSKKDQKKAAPAAKPGANTTATKSTPVAVATTVEDVPRIAGGRPDQAAFNAQQEALKKEIDGVQAKLSAVKDKIGSLGKGGAANERKSELKAQLEDLRSQQAGNKGSRSQILDSMKALQEENQKKIKDLQAAKSKLPYKSAQDVDNQIKKLDAQVESGNMKIADEKRALAEISQLKRSRKTVESFQTEEDAIQANKAQIDEYKQQLDDPEAKAVSERFDAVKKELDEIKKEQDEAYQSRNVIYDERSQLSAQLDELYQKKRDSNAAFREANDRFYTKLNEERARRHERQKQERLREEAQRRKDRAQQIREEAEAPAFQLEIEDCQTLIDLFSGKITGAAADNKVSTSKATGALANVPELALRQVEADPTLVPIKKKGQEEENYFVAKKKKAPGGKPTPAPAPPAPAPKPEDRFNVSFSTLTALGTLSIPPPSSNADVERCIADLQKKKDWYVANQKRVTAEKIAKADAEIAKLEALEDGANGHSAEAPNGNGEDPVEPTDTPAATEVVSTTAPSEEVDQKLEEAKEEEA